MPPSSNRAQTQLLTIAKAAKILSVTTTTLRKWDKQGLLPAIHIGTRGDRRYRFADIYTFLKKQRLGKSKKITWYKQAGDGQPWLFYPPAERFIDMKNGVFSGMQYWFFYIEDEKLHAYYDIDELNALAEAAYKLRGEKMDEWYDTFLLAGEEIQKMHREFFHMDWSKVSNEELLWLNQKLQKHYAEFWNYSLFIDAFDAGFDQKEIKKIQAEYTLSDEDVLTLTTPKDLLFSQEYELGLLRLASQSKVSPQDIQKFIEDFDWIKSSYANASHLSELEIVSEIQKHKELGATKERIAKLLTLKSEKEKSERVTLKQRDLSENPLSFFQKITYWREVRKKFNLIGFNCLDAIAKELARRSGIPDDIICYILPEEVIDVLAGKVTSKTLQSRKDGSIMFIYEKNRERLDLFGAEAKSVFEDISHAHLNQEKNNIISGTVASQGYARGVARVVMNEKDFSKFKEGEVLVTSMTRPEFVPLMKIACGIVTDEGGITSHAAIVSRELKKPCIIGTQTGTKKIKDGDMVEVRAHHGTVRIL